MRLEFLSGVVLAGLLIAGCMTTDVRRAEQLAASGDWDGAVAAYREAVKKDPHDQALQQRLEYAKASAAEQHYTEGRRHLQNNRISEALQEFKLALGLNPAQREHHAAMGDVMRLKEAREQLQAADKLRNLGRFDEALEAYERAVELDPSLTQALDGITATTVRQRAAKTLGGSSQPITLRFQNAKLKEVFEILARTAALNVVFDKEVKDDPITIFIKDLPFDEALNLILNTNALMARRIGPDTLLIIPNTKPKQDQYQDLMIRTFYLSNAKAKDVVNLIRTMLESKRVYVDEHLNALVIRDQPVKLHLAERMIMALDHRESEVQLDVEVLEVDRTKSLKYGVNFAKQAGVGVVPPGLTGSLSANASTFTFDQLTSLGPSSYLFTLPTSVLLDFFKQESNAKTLAAPKLRVVNNKSASINIGDKQPILLSTTNVLPGQAATGAVPTTSTVTSIEFKDTGIKLTVEPTVNLIDELTLKLKIEITRLGDQVTLQASPEIKQFRFGTRAAETVLNMKDDETVVLAGLIQDEERKTRSTVPLLGDIPVLGELFTSTTQDTITTEVVLTITPHIVRNIDAPSFETQAFWSGTESTYATTPLFSPELLQVSHRPSGVPTDIPQAPASQVMPTQPSGLSTPPAPGGLPPAPQPSPQAVLPPAPQAVPQPPPPVPSSSQAMPQATPPPISQLGPPAPSGAQATPQPAPPTPPQVQPEMLARGAGVLAIRPPQLSTTVGQEIAVDVTAGQLDSLTESIVSVIYNPQVLEFRRVMDGEMLKRDNVPASASVSANPAVGQVAIHLRRQGASVSGSGVLARLFFQAKSAGTSPLTIQQATVVGAGGKHIPVTVERAVVVVQ
jgi:general secretion pathway protein D